MKYTASISELRDVKQTRTHVTGVLEEKKKGRDWKIYEKAIMEKFLNSMQQQSRDLRRSTNLKHKTNEENAT
jgi:hypothetical protein